MSDENTQIERLERVVYGDSYSEDPLARDGLKRRVEDLEAEIKLLKPIGPYITLIATAGKYLGIPSLIGLAYTIFRYLTGV